MDHFSLIFHLQSYILKVFREDALILAALPFVWGLEEGEAGTHDELMFVLLTHHMTAEMTQKLLPATVGTFPEG